ncbi:RNA-binding protein 12B-like [Pyxicephalus adspersus]|uniref:RNA-binding protein 12B-like n=1 Tax=Pyxicephalus adspersus TaxID=30357 RepID=UPI003B5B6D1F
MSVKVRLQGLPSLADSIHIRRFFNGLNIPSGGVNIIGGVDGEAFVKFKTFHDACQALQRSGRPLMNSCIQVSLDSKAEQVHKNHRYKSVEKPGYVRVSLHPFDASFSDVKKFFKSFSVKSVIFLTKNKVRNGQALVKFAKHKHACKALIWSKGTSKEVKHEKCFSIVSIKQSDEAEWIKFGGKVDLPEKYSTSKSCCRSDIPYDEPNTLYIHEFYAHLINVSRHAEKRHIKRFLYDLVDDSQITFVYDKNGCRTRDCFVMFVTDDDFTRALALDKSPLKGRCVRVLPVSKAQVKEFVDSRKMDITEDPASEEDFVLEDGSPSPSSLGSKLTCIYLRNFAADVNKMDILNFFTGFCLNEEDIHLLHDDNGDGLGEALVKFSSEEEAASAEMLNRKCFQGTEILLRCISEEQLKVFGVDHFGSSLSDSLDLSSCKEDCQLEELQVCVSVEDDTPDVTYDSS